MNFLITLRNKARNVWRSKTIWFNGVLLAILPLTEMMQVALPQLQQFLPDNLYKTVGLATLIGNIVLRFFTKAPLEAK